MSLFSNGARIADNALADALAGAGLTGALISLHAPDAALSDNITGMPGAFQRTVRGIHNLMRRNIPAVLSCVIHGANVHCLADFARFAAAEFPGAPVNYSFIAPLFDACARPDIVPSFAAAAPRLLDALDACDALGAPVDGLEPHWGMPPCVIGADARYFSCMRPARMSDIPPDFVKRADCPQCALDAACFGVRKGYAALHGLEELRPLIRRREGGR